MAKKINNRGRMHYAWLILITCCIFYSMTMGVLQNCQGLFHTAIYQNMGWKYSDYCFSTIFNGLSAAAAMVLAGKIYDKYPLRPVIVILTIVYGLGFALRGAAHTIAGFCAVYTLIGISSAFILYIPVPMLLNAWFVKKKNLALSIAMMTSGLSGMIFNPILQSLITRYGWRVASFVNGGITIAVSLPFLLLFAVKKPEDIGLRPYGAEEAEEGEISREEQTHTAETAGKEEKPAGHPMVTAFILAGFLSFISFMPQQFSNYASSIGLSPAIGALMVSFAMAGNISGKLLVGILVDRIGSRRTYVSDMIFITAAVIVLLFNPRSLAVLYIAAFFVGFSCANNVLLPPMAVGTFSPGESYTSNLAKTNSATMIMSAVSLYLTGWLFDLSGDYSICFIVLAVIQISSMFLAMRIFGRTKSKVTG